MIVKGYAIQINKKMFFRLSRVVSEAEQKNRIAPFPPCIHLRKTAIRRRWGYRLSLLQYFSWLSYFGKIQVSCRNIWDVSFTSGIKREWYVCIVLIQIMVLRMAHRVTHPDQATISPSCQHRSWCRCSRQRNQCHLRQCNNRHCLATLHTSTTTTMGHHSQSRLYNQLKVHSNTIFNTCIKISLTFSLRARGTIDVIIKLLSP
jgi:hypothetical protein